MTTTHVRYEIDVTELSAELLDWLRDDHVLELVQDGPAGGCPMIVVQVPTREHGQKLERALYTELPHLSPYGALVQDDDGTTINVDTLA